MMDAYKDRDMANFDVPGAHLHTFPPDNKNIIMALRNGFVDITCEFDPDNRKHVVHLKNGKKILYLKVLNAIYGCIESVLCWYNHFSTTLKDKGVVINRYDRCVVNKVIYNKQCTISGYVDSNKLSYKDPEVVSSVLKTIEDHFGKLVVDRGKTHNFLGIKIHITKNKAVEISMKDQIEEAIKMFGKELKGFVSSPATKKVSTVNPTTNQMSTLRTRSSNILVVSNIVIIL